MAAKGLNAKQQRFVKEYLIDLNATQAAIRAGYKADNADVTGPRLLGNVGVAAAIAEGQTKAAHAADLSAESVLRNLESARAGAMGENQFAAAIRACELQGKHLGMFIDRKEVTNTRLVAHGAEKVKDGTQWLEKHRPH